MATVKTSNETPHDLSASLLQKGRTLCLVSVPCLRSEAITWHLDVTADRAACCNPVRTDLFRSREPVVYLVLIVFN